MYAPWCVQLWRHILDMNLGRLAEVASRNCADFAVRNIGCAWTTFEYSMTFPARSSRFWRSCPNRRLTYGSHSSETRVEAGPTFRNQGRSVALPEGSRNP